MRSTNGWSQCAGAQSGWHSVRPPVGRSPSWLVRIVGAKPMRVFAILVPVLLTFGCAKTREGRSGDLIWFLMQEIPKSGGRISFTGQLPRAETTWTFTSSGNHLVVNAVGDHMDTVNVFLRAGFAPRSVATNDAQGQSHWIYVSDYTGTVIECAGTSNGFRLVCATPRK